MVQTRRGGQPAAATQPVDDKENQSPPADRKFQAAPTKKRKSDANTDPDHAADFGGKQKTNKMAKDQIDEASSARPRLTTPDLEFDYDRSKLRDSRRTPGRRKRPRYEKLDIPRDVLAWLKATREIPKPQKPKGHVTAAQKEKLEEEETLMNPLAFSHDIYKCLAKGREGGPTYHGAGFELEYDKVFESIHGYCDSDTIVRNMESALDRMVKESSAIYKLFFVDLKWKKKAKYEYAPILFYITDQVS